MVDHMNYTVRGSRVCCTHRVSPKAREADINLIVGQLGRTARPELRAAVIEAIAPTTSANCRCGIVSEVIDSGEDADWLVRCRNCDIVRACTEHKPKGAPSAWSPVAAAVYDAMDPGYDGRAPFATPDWFAALPDACKAPHLFDECDGWHPRVSDKSQTRKRGRRVDVLAAPQVLKYAHLHPDLPITVVNDSGLCISELYETAGRVGRNRDNESYQFGFTLDDARFPIITTHAVLSKLVESLDGMTLEAEHEADVRAVVEAMAMRAGIVTDLDVDERWLRPAVRDCARNDGCELVDWATFVAGHCE